MATMNGAPMQVDVALANASNAGMLAALLLYGAAGSAYASDFLVSRKRRVVLAAEDLAAEAAMTQEGAAMAAAGARTGARSGAQAGGPDISRAVSGATAAGPARVTGRGSGQADSPRAGLPAQTRVRIALSLTVVGLVAQVIALVMRGLSEHRVPLGNMYEFIAVCTCMTVIALIAAGLRYGAHFLGAFVLLPVVSLLLLDTTVVYTPAGPVAPALNSYWIWIHVTAMTVSVGLFLVGAVATLMFLVADWQQERQAAGKRSIGSGFMARLATPATLDRLSYRSVLFGFPVWTFGIIIGAIWADHAWGRYWGWDPKEVWSFVTWIMFAVYLHARATPGFRGAKAAIFHLAGFSCLLFNVIAVNLWVSGLHSYAGMR